MQIFAGLSTARDGSKFKAVLKWYFRAGTPISWPSFLPSLHMGLSRNECHGKESRQNSLAAAPILSCQLQPIATYTLMAIHAASSNAFGRLP